jgi:hypothetical protein
MTFLAIFVAVFAVVFFFFLRGSSRDMATPNNRRRSL